MTLEQEAEATPIHAAAHPHDQAPGSPADLEGRGWSSLSVDCQPKIRALATLASLPGVESLASVSYASKGNALVIGGDERAVAAARQLSASLPVTLLLTSRPSAQAAALAGADLEGTAFPIWGGKVASLKGYLGNFTVLLADLAAVRDATGRALPGEAGAVFDIVVDFSDPPLFGHHQPPQGYWRVADDASLAAALEEAPDAVGEFEKPRYVQYDEKLCAHSRNGKTDGTQEQIEESAAAQEPQPEHHRDNRDDCDNSPFILCLVECNSPENNCCDAAEERIEKP